MAAFSKRLKGAMSSYFDAGKGKENENDSVFLTEVPNGTTDLAAAEDPTARAKKKRLEVRSILCE